MSKKQLLPTGNKIRSRPGNVQPDKLMSVLALVVFFDILGSSLVETLWGNRKDAVGVNRCAVNPKLAAFQLITNVFPVS